MGDMSDWHLEQEFLAEEECDNCFRWKHECDCEDEYDGEPDELDLYCAAAEVDDCGDR